MPVSVRVPKLLRGLTNGASVVPADGNSLKDVLASVERAYPGFQERVLTDGGEITPHIMVFVAGENVRYLDGINTPVKDGDEISLVPASAGG